MGRRSRQKAPTSTYSDDAGNELVLRGSLTPATRAEYASVGGTREDAWHRQVEFLFERLAVGWTVAGVETTKQKELLARFRVSTAEERAWIRSVLREHLTEWFPDVEAP